MNPQGGYDDSGPGYGYAGGSYAGNGYEDGVSHHHRPEYYAEPYAGSALFRALPHRPPFVAHPHLNEYGAPDERGAPVSAVAAVDGDGRGAGPDLLYVASHASHQGGGRLRGAARPDPRGGAAASERDDPALSRGGRLTVLYDAAATEGRGGYYGEYGGRDVYATFVAHAQADATRLDALHSALFGGGGDAPCYRAPLAPLPQARPSHAYAPPVGPPSLCSR